MWTSNSVDYSSLRVFGCLAYVHISSEERLKIDTKSKQCIFLEYQKRIKGFMFWNPKAKKVVISRYVIFNENVMLHRTLEE